MTYKSDCELLGIPHEDDVSPTDVKSVFRAKALELHPDVGGDRDRFEALREAYNRVYSTVQKSWSVCPGCNGTGTREKRKGVILLRQRCEVCKGTGERK